MWLRPAERCGASLRVHPGHETPMPRPVSWSVAKASMAMALSGLTGLSTGRVGAMSMRSGTAGGMNSSQAAESGPSNPVLLSEAYVCDRLDVSRHTLRRLTASGAIGCVRLGLGDRRKLTKYTSEQVEAFIASQTKPAATVAPEPPAKPVPTRSRRRSQPEAQTARQVADELIRQAVATVNTR